MGYWQRTVQVLFKYRAADVNTISQKHVRQHQVSPTTERLNIWNKTNLKPVRETRLKLKNHRPSSESEIKFIVVPNGFTNLLGLNTIQELGFITINKEFFLSHKYQPLNLVIWAKLPRELMKVFLPKYCLVGRFLLPFKTQ